MFVENTTQDPLLVGGGFSQDLVRLAVGLHNFSSWFQILFYLPNWRVLFVCPGTTGTMHRPAVVPQHGWQAAQLVPWTGQLLYRHGGQAAQLVPCTGQLLYRHGWQAAQLVPCTGQLLYRHGWQAAQLVPCTGQLLYRHGWQAAHCTTGTLHRHGWQAAPGG